jgi:TonB family protein
MPGHVAVAARNSMARRLISHVKRFLFICSLIPSIAWAQASSPSPTAPPTSASPAGLTPPAPSGPPHTCGDPPVAIRGHATGSTIVAVKVTTAGTVKDAVVAQSSGFSQLDEAARLCVLGWLYTPAMQNGKPLESIDETIFDWRERPAAGSPRPGNFVSFPVWKSFEGMGCELWHQGAIDKVELAFDVGIDGSVKDVSLLKGSGNPSIDKDAVDCVAKRVYAPGTQNGEPIEVRITATMY